MAKAVINDSRIGKVKRIETSNFGSAKIIYNMPFRVKFTTIGIESYGSNNAAPIGIAVIGFNNYIL